MSTRDVAERLRSRRVYAEVKTADGAIHVRGLSGKERDDYYSWIRGTSEAQGSLLLSDQRIVGLALCEPDGTPSYASMEEGLATVADWNMEDVTAAAKEVLRLSGMNRGAADDAEKK